MNHKFFSLREKHPSEARGKNHKFFSLREKYPSEAKGDEPQILLPPGEVPERSEGG